METTTPAELLDLKARIDQWHETRKYKRERMPAELRQATVNISRRYPGTLVRRVLKLDPWRLHEPATKKITHPARSRQQQTAFFQLPTTALAPEPLSAGLSAEHCRLQIERRDGSRLTLTMPSLDLLSMRQLCADFLSGRKQ